MDVGPFLLVARQSGESTAGSSTQCAAVTRSELSSSELGHPYQRRGLSAQHETGFHSLGGTLNI